MDRTTALTWSYIGVMTPKRYAYLIQAYGDLKTALQKLNREMLRSLRCREDTIVDALQRKDAFDPARYQAELQKRGIEFLTREDTAYPERLREVPDPPTFLYARGDLSVLKQKCIALVGTRKMSSYGKRATERITDGLVNAGVVTISGLAYGIDTHVARVTLRTGGRTVAVLAHGLGNLHPRGNVALAEQVVREGGLLLSEFPLDAPADKYTFPSRNRIVAALSLGVVVLEAGEGSGALITADFAHDYARELFVVPGQIFDAGYQGCNALLATGQAKLVSSAKGILEELQMKVAPEKKPELYVPQTPEETELMSALSTMPQSASQLAEVTGLTASSINIALTMLELAGAAKNIGGGMWVET